MPRPPRRLSITSLFTLATIVPLVLVGVLLLVLAERSINQASAAMGRDILEESSHRVDKDVRTYLEHTRRMSDLLAGLISDEVISSRTYDAWTNRFLIRLRTTPEVSSICFTNESLDTIYLMRYPPALEYGLATGHANGSTMKTYVAQSDGTMSAQPRRVYEYEPRSREWWKLGHASDEPVWTRPYQWFQDARRNENTLAIAYTRTIRDRSGNRLGVLSVDATLQQINEHLATITRLPDAYILITDDQEQLVASSLKRSDGELLKISALRQSTVEQERDAARLLAMVDAQKGAAAQVRMDHQLYWVRQVTLSIDRGPRWKMTLAVPDDQLLQGAKMSIQWMRLVGTLSLTAAVAFAIFLARRVTRPMTQLASFAREVGGGRFDGRVDAATTREFDELSNALNQMAANLQERVELMAQKDAAQDAAAMKGRLIAHVSHEFRTPLNAIIGYGELVKEAAEGKQDEQTASDADKVLLASRHLLTLINNLLDLSRIDAGRMRLDIVGFSVSALLKEVADVVRPVVVANDNQFEVRGDLKDDTMESDPARLKQVLINLLGNAAKFTSRGRIEMAAEPIDDQTLRFRVLDTGPGLSQEQLDRLFEPFGKVDAQHAPGKSGAGLGLAISRQLCTLLGGTIELSSEVGRGTEVSVTFPRRYRGSREITLT